MELYISANSDFSKVVHLQVLPSFQVNKFKPFLDYPLEMK